MTTNTDNPADAAAGGRPTAAVAATDTPAEGAPGVSAAPGAPSDDGSVAAGVAGVVRSALDAASKAGTISVSGLTDALERAGRSLSRRVVEGAETRRPPIADRAALATALADKPPAPALAGATAAAVALRVATRFKPLSALAKRSPMWLLAAAVPALAASVTRGADELGMVASHLIHRARATGVEPDLERVRRTAVQIVSRKPVDPEVEPSHGTLAFGWLKRAARAALPFTAGVATADPEGLAEAAAAFDATRLGPR
jgi:hypothetical protein